MNTFLPFKLMQLTGDPMTEHTQSSLQLRHSPWLLRVSWALAGIMLVLVAACGGGGGATKSTTPAVVVVTDKMANTQALASMASTPVNVDVWDLLNNAGADIVRTMVPATETVFISTFKTIADPTGGPGTVKVFDAIVASGSLDSGRVFQLSTGTLPAGTTLIWVNVNGEDFTKNNPDAESALEISAANLGSALPVPVP